MGATIAADPAVVVIVSADVAELEPGVTEVGEKLQDVSAGRPLQASCTALLKLPPTEETVTV